MMSRPLAAATLFRQFFAVVSRSRARALTGVVALVVALTPSCHSSGGPQVGSQTNWMRLCDKSTECGELTCICGTCTESCTGSAQCSALDGGACVASQDEGAVALCDGVTPPSGMCLPLCDDGPCPEGTSCLAGVCAPVGDATDQVSVEPETQHQTLIGFGASLAYDDDFIADYPEREQLLDAMFLDSGFEAVRLRNRYEPGNEDALSAAAEILAGAEARLEQSPTLFITSGSPPAELKANGDRYCVDVNTDCTLVRNADGEFDYAAFAEYWRASLEAYEQVGVVPDFVSIQNNPDWLPREESAEACRFLPEEGVGSVEDLNGEVLDVEFPGYAEAMAAVSASVDTLPSQYSFSGPEVGGVASIDEYAGVLAPVDSIAYHLYDIDPTAVASDELEGVSALSDEAGKPSVQTEMQAGGLETAVLVHYALTVASSSAYLQQHFVTSTIEEDSPALIGAGEETIEKLPVYHALHHFARFTDPGWVRIEMTGGSEELLPSAWSSPNGDTLTIVLVNPTEEPTNVELVLPAAMEMNQLRVIRTVFNGIERSAELGELAEEHVVRVPGQAVVTVTSLSDDSQ